MIEDQKEWLDRMFGRYHNKVIGYFLKKIRSREEAEDLASSVFVEMSRSAGRFDPKRACESTWIYAICRNLLNRHLRDSYTHARILPIDRSVSVEDVDPCSNETGIEIERIVTADALAGALSRLHQEERDILIFSFYHGLKPQEIATRMGLSYGNVCVKKTRALRALEAALR